MEHLRINKPLVVYTLLIFLAGVIFAGAVLTVNGYDVPWSINRTALAETQETVNTGTPAGTFCSGYHPKIVDAAGPAS